MEIIREATVFEAINLEGATLLSNQIIQYGLLAGYIAGIIWVCLIATGNSTASVISGTITFILLLGSLGSYYFLSPHEQATFDEHNYFLALIDDSANFEHASYRLLDHHEDNTYFVERITASPEGQQK